MQGWNSSPRKKALTHTRSVNLVHHNIKLVLLAQCIHFELTCPTTILPYILDIVIYILVIFYKELISVFVLLDKVCCLNSIMPMSFFFTFQLVSYGSEKTISVRVYLFNSQSKTRQLLSEFLKIFSIQHHVHLFPRFFHLLLMLSILLLV